MKRKYIKPEPRMNAHIVMMLSFDPLSVTETLISVLAMHTIGMNVPFNVQKNHAVR